jgi:cell wall-associated NlpC family hydrolase
MDMLWLGKKMSRRAFIDGLKLLAGLGVGAAVGIPLGVRFLREARASGEPEPSSPPADSQAETSTTKEPALHIAAASSTGSIASIRWLPEPVQRWSAEVEAAAGAQDVDPKLVALLILIRSAGNPYAVDLEGALGLMQIKAFNASGANLLDPAQNILVGVNYLAAQYARFGDWSLAVTAYDDGPGHVSRGTVTPGGEVFARQVADMWAEAGDAESRAWETWAASQGSELLQKTAQLDAYPIAYKAVGFAARHWGKPYLWGGEGPDRWDCSALVQAAYRYAGVEIPRTATDQWYGAGRALGDGEERLPGDLVFFTLDGSSSDHVGIVIYPPDSFLEASGQAGLVRVSSLDAANALYQADLAERMLGVKRVI